MKSQVKYTSVIIAQGVRINESQQNTEPVRRVHAKFVMMVVLTAEPKQIHLTTAPNLCFLPHKELLGTAEIRSRDTIPF